MKVLALIPILISFLLYACSEPEKSGPEAIYYNGVIYSQDSLQPVVAAMAVKDRRILALGNDAEILALAGTKTLKVDLQGQFVMPGFIEGHAHLLGIGESLRNLGLMETGSWDEVVQLVEERVKDIPEGRWIQGRGWHHEKWSGDATGFIGGYPTHSLLSRISPLHPVILKHASGHALIANAAAMTLASIRKDTPDPPGGKMIRDEQGNPTGVFEENAMDLITDAFNAYQDARPRKERDEETLTALNLAQEACLAQGITSFQDAGSSRELLEMLRSLAKQDALKIRLWVMLNEPVQAIDKASKGLPWIGLGNGMLTARSIKLYIDGALGSHGAWLLAPYSDKPAFTGQNVIPPDTIAAVGKLALDRKLQLCVHAIGDRANREVLNIYEQLFQAHPENNHRRWRIEHAQHLDTLDIPRFSQLGVIASMQPVHCISDAPFVEKRLGPLRSKTGGYVWRSLLDAGAPLAMGTDAPVEYIDPFTNIYAAVTRRRNDNDEPFFPEQAMTRKEALYLYTMGNAWAAFEENEKGSLSPGKFADFIILSDDLSGCAVDDIRKINVLATFLGGKEVYKRKE